MVTEFFLSKTCCSVAKWCPTLCNLCPPLSPGICSNSCPLSRWCYQTISSSVSVRLIQVSVSSVEFSCSVVSDSLWPTPWIAARQASMSITNSRGLHKPISIESVMPPNYLILCRPLLLPPSIFSSIRVFSNESVLCIRWPKYGVSASASVLPMNIQDWFPLEWTGWISLQSKGLSRVFSNTTVQKHQFFGTQLSL